MPEICQPQKPDLKLVFRSWCAARFVAMKSLWTIAIGGAAGGGIDYIRCSLAHHSSSFGFIDWHQFALSSAGSALLALLYHWQLPPAQQIPTK